MTDDAPRPGDLKSRLTPWLGEILIIGSLALFTLAYHVVFPSDDIFAVRVIRKQSPGIAGTVVNVPSFVNGYNAASLARQQELERTYLYRRLVETGMVVEVEG